MTAFLAIFYTGNYTSYGHLMEECPDQLSDNARFCFEHGSQASAADYARALRSVDVMRARIDDLMDTYDLLLTPTMAVPPFPIGQNPQQIAGKDVAKSAFSPMTRPFNLSGQPAASIPCGFSGEGLPIGLHIIGRRGDEATVLRASAAFEQARPWEHHRPDID